VVIQKLETAVQKLDAFMKSQGLDCAPEAVPNLKGDAARAAFIEHFKEVQRLKTQLDQYTDLTDENAQRSNRSCRATTCLASAAPIWKPPSAFGPSRARAADKPSQDADQLDFEFVLFASAVIDYDYIMGLIARYSEATPGKQKMSREELIGLIQSDAKFMDEREDIAAYINTLKAGEGSAKRPSARATAASRRRRTRRNWRASRASTGWRPRRCKALSIPSCNA
jgi:type I restriction enzyme, R subunit